jgi:GT2 family glycosyltransferase
MISVIILNYNRKSDLNRTLLRLYDQKGAEFETVLIDQNSNDGSVEMVMNEFPQVRLFPLKENLGVAGGRNRGAELAIGEYLVFLDDDAEFVGTDELKKVQLVFDNNLNIHVMAFNINGHPERPERYKFFSKSDDRFVNHYIGCGHAIRKSTFQLLGGYSMELFFWGEEIEFAIKSFSLPRNKILFKGDIVVFHRVSAQSRLKWKEGRFYYKVRNRLVLMRKYFPFYFSFILVFKYMLLYSIRAIQLREYKSFYHGVMDSFKPVIQVNRKLNFIQTLKWFFN